MPSRRRRRFCSKQSSRDSLTVEATRKPAAGQFCKATSVLERDRAEVTAATTTAAASVHSTSTGRSFEAVPLVKGMSAIQTSPGCGIIVEPLILRGIAVQEGAVVTCGHAAVGGRRRNKFKLLAALVNPGSQSNEVLDGEFFHRLLNFLDVAHVPSPTEDSTPLHGSTLRVFEPSPAITGESGHDISYFLWPSFRVVSFHAAWSLRARPHSKASKAESRGVGR